MLFLCRRRLCPVLVGLGSLLVCLLAGDAGAAAAGESAENREVETQRDYFRNWTGGPIRPAELRSMFRQARSLPSEEPVEGRPDVTNSWQLLGPLYMTNPRGGQMTGRVRDIDPVNFRVLAASGGLWGFYFVPYLMSDAVESNWYGSVATKPDDPNTILIGTGEYDIGGGTGIWKTTDAGATWAPKSLPYDPYWIPRVRWSPDGRVAYAATVYGLYRSTDGGETWNVTLPANVTDVAVVPSYTGLIYATAAEDGLYRSTNAGATWTKMTGGGIPTSGMEEGSVSAIQPDAFHAVWIYVSFVNAGVWRTTDGGTSWTNITPSPDVNRFWYCNVIAASPANPQNVMVGGVGARVSHDGGATWSSMVDPNLHADYHAFGWAPNGNDVYAGHDGGWSHSSDQGRTWDTNANVMPVTQFYDVDCEKGETGYMIGASQDNNVAYTPTEALNWTLPAIGSTEGDGLGCCISQYNPTEMWCLQGVYGGNYSYERQHTTNGGATWAECDHGIDPNTHGGRIRTDNITPPHLATCAGGFVYVSSDFGNSWAKSNPTAFPATVIELTSSSPVSPSAVLYACLNSDVTGQRLYVLDHGTWSERDAGLPTGVSIRTVVPHPWSAFASDAWALMNGTTTPGQQVFHTTNRGITWINITGDLPAVPMGGIVPDPQDYTHVLYLGTMLGCYMTTNGGMNWERWNNGLSPGVMVTEMGYIDLRPSGPFEVIAATYGRSVFKRDGAGSDPAGIGSGRAVARALRLDPASPNPFSTSTQLRFFLPEEASTRLELYDLNGRRIMTAGDGRWSAGSHVLPFDGRNLPAGSYYLRLQSGEGAASGRITIIR